MFAHPNTSRFTRQRATSTALGSTPPSNQRTLAKLPVTKPSALRENRRTDLPGISPQPHIPKEMRRPLTAPERAAPKRAPLTAVRTHQVRGGNIQEPASRRATVVSDFEVPDVMVDKERNRTYTKMGYLGEVSMTRNKRTYPSLISIIMRREVLLNATKSKVPPTDYTPPKSFQSRHSWNEGTRSSCLLKSTSTAP